MAKEFNLDYYSIAQLLKFPVVLGIDSQERLKGTSVPRLAYISGLKSLSFPLPVFPFIIFYDTSSSDQFRLHRNDLTAENAENAEGAQREMNNSDEGRN